MKKILILLMFVFSLHSEERLSQYEEDPLEDFNRIVFNLADKLDSSILRPTAAFYSENTPTIVKSSVSNFFNNLSEVDTIANQLLQGKFRLAADDSFRFLINSTFLMSDLVREFMKILINLLQILELSCRNKNIVGIVTVFIFVQQNLDQ